MTMESKVAIPDAVVRLGSAIGFFEDYSFTPQIGKTVTDSIPHHIRYAPRKHIFNPGKLVDSLTDGVLSLLGEIRSVGKNNLMSDFNEWSNPDNYSNFFIGNVGNGVDKLLELPLPTIAINWREDQTFASQFLSGPNPMLIRYVENRQQLPDDLVKFNAQPFDEFEKIVPELTGSTLDTLIDEKRLFIVDYEILKGCPTKSDQKTGPRVLYAPIVLCYIDKKVSSNGILLPLGIQLCRKDDTTAVGIQGVSSDHLFDYQPLQTGKIFYNSPIAKDHSWLYAKMCVMNANLAYHEAIIHLGFTHLLMEPIIISLYKVFEKKFSSHWLWHLLLPHTSRTIYINEQARVTLLAHDAPFSTDDITSMGVEGTLYLVNKAYEQLNCYEQAHLPTQLKNRGLLDDTLLPHFYYRDYGLLVWGCIESYVREVLKSKQCPTSDEEVQQDAQLQAFIATCQNEGNIRSFPSVSNLTELHKLLCSIIWTASAQHAAVNFPQYDFNTFQPNHPGVLTKPMPNDPTIVTERFITSSLPNIKQTAETIILMKNLSMNNPADLHLFQQQHKEVTNDLLVSSLLHFDNRAKELFSGSHRHPHETEWFFADQHQQFANRLKQVERIMRERNSRENSTYHYLYPSEIPASISV